MKKLTVEDVRNLHEYELVRDEWRKAVIAEKAKRRVLLGPLMSFVFENRLTVLAQVQEMCRAERIARPEGVQQEIDVYGELLPGPGELAGTLMVEITEASRVQPELDRLVGLGRGDRLWLQLGERRVYARFDEGQGRQDRISAVQYLRFPVGEDPALREALGRGEVDARLVVDHPAYRAEAPLPPGMQRELARDLSPE